MIRPIERIPASSVRDFLVDHIEPQRPVIITGLYSGQKIDGINTPAAAMTEWGDVMLRLGRNYHDVVFGSDKDRADEFVLTLREYFQLISDDPTADILCREQELDEKMRSSFAVPEITQRGFPPSEVTRLMYVSKDGLIAPLHFDGDHCEVLFTQVIGRKRIFLIEPKYSARFYSRGNLSQIPVHKFDETEKNEFFKFNSAYECVLEPGETLYFPKLWWHYLENIGTTLAFNVRFGLFPQSRWLRLLPLNWRTQNLFVRILDSVAAEPTDRLIFDRLFEIYFSKWDSPEKRRRAFEAHVEQSFSATCRDAIQVNYAQPTIDSSNQELKMFNPICFGKGPLRSPCSKQDIRRLNLMLKEHRVSKADLGQLLSNYGIVGPIENLTRLECHVLVNALAKPPLFPVAQRSTRKTVRKVA